VPLQPQTNPVAGSNYTLNATIMDGSQTPRVPLDLTGATVVCKVVHPDGTHATLGATMINAAQGQVQVDFGPLDLPTGGAYTYAFEVTFSDGTAGTTDPPQALTVSAALF